jgi:steroid 5-alpha reductase family enzyme
MSRSSSIVLNIAFYILALLVVMVTFSFTGHLPVLMRIALADLAGTVVIFLFSLGMNNSSMYDPYWSVKPLVIAAYYFFGKSTSEVTVVDFGALLLISLYALRLTANFYRGWQGLKHEDWRYRNFRKQFPKAYWIVSFFGIHFFPTLMVYLGCLPMFIVFNQPLQVPFLAITGLVVTAGSIVLAFVADEQLRAFRSTPKNKGKTMNLGLWSKSRHPNYLGEILFWWGLFLIALAFGWQYWWTGVGALAITLMFVFISIPLMENHALSRRSDFKDYIRNVPFLFPVKI